MLNINSSNESLLRTAIRSALNGEAILFLGAGAAKDAKKSNGEPLPTGQELADLLAKECKLSNGYTLDAIAQHFVDEYSETKLINTLRKLLKVSNVGNVLTLLGSVNWLRVWTTNYDDAFEQALKINNRQYYSLTTAADVHNARGNKFIVLHINGLLSSLNQAVTSDFILTSQSYATQTFSENNWATVLRNDLQLSKAIIFIGYSLADIDISRLIFNPNTLHNKIHFIDRIGIDRVLNSKLSKFGTVHAIGLEKFTEIFSEEKREWVKPDLVENYQCWKPIEIQDGLKEPSDDDFYDLILKGEIKDGLLLNQLNTPNHAIYIVARSCEEKCLKHLGQENAVAVLVGAFCNGKTVTLKSIALNLVAGGRDVFILDHPYDSAFNELQRLCRRDSNFILIIENYSRNIELVSCFCNYARPDCGLVLTERSGIHDLKLGALAEYTKKRELATFELDVLDNDEIARFSSLLDTRGLWGERAGLSELQRVAFLKQECNRQLQAVLLEVAKSPQVREKLSNIVSHFESVEGGLKMLIGLCLLQVIGETPKIDVASELLGFSYDAFSRFKKDEVVRQIVDVQSNVANFRSPVMARAVLNGIEHASVITEIVAECVKRGHEARHADKFLEDISIEFMRFANLERILPEGKGKRPALQNLYEDLGAIKTIREHPYFWLQYAMARLSLGDLDIARRYFENSYSHAKNIKGFDTFQIDNHFCRLLLREAEDAVNHDEAFKKVDEALTTLKKQVLRENRHYPYRSAWSLEGVAKRHGTNWNEEQRRSVINGCRYLIDAATRLDPKVARETAVIGGLQRLNKVIDVLNEK